MDAKELMLGDYVIRKNVPKEILIVDAIDSIKNIVYLDLDGLGITEKIENIEPIPITSEILEKNGWFPLDEYRYEGDIALAKGRNYFRLKNTTICINSVHELQHALRLCGIDKEIKI